MGLDMYLSKRHYVQNWEHNGPERQHKITVEIGGKPHPHIKTDKISYIIEQVAYWRKANQIHEWFVQHCQEGRDECQESYVTLAQLQELYDTCVLVRDNSKLKDGTVNNGASITLDPVSGQMVETPITADGKIIEDSSVAEDLLPTASGFFFGGTDYDQSYMQDILNTIEMLKPELEAKYENGFYEPEYYYRASW
jgi:hypothetical protein